MTTPKIYDLLPDVYDKTDTCDTFIIFNAIQDEIDGTQTAVDDFNEDQTISTSDGDGLSRLGELFNVARPPGMDDEKYRAVISAIAGARRCTIHSIKAVFEAASGLNATVEDIQTNSAIPAFEIWISLDPLTIGSSEGRGFYPEFPTNKDGYPVESSLAGVVFDETGAAGGLFNDHAWNPIDLWTQALVDKVRPAGTKIVYKV